MPTGDPFCPCGCGGFLGQCRKERQQSTFEPEVVEARPVTDRLLMSDVLKDVMPDDMAPTEESLEFIIVVLGCVAAGSESPIVGTLQGFMFSDDGVLELEVKVPLTEAMLVTRAAPSRVELHDVGFSFVELHQGNDVSRFEGPFELKGARLGDIDKRRGMCVLLLNLHD